MQTQAFHSLDYGEHTVTQESERMVARRWTTATSGHRYDTTESMEGRMSRREAQMTLGAYERGRTEGVFHLFEEVQVDHTRAMQCMAPFQALATHRGTSSASSTPADRIAEFHAQNPHTTRSPRTQSLPTRTKESSGPGDSYWHR